jgi:hypothetical protein
MGDTGTWVQSTPIRPQQALVETKYATDWQGAFTGPTTIKSPELVLMPPMNQLGGIYCGAETAAWNLPFHPLGRSKFRDIHAKTH